MSIKDVIKSSIIDGLGGGAELTPQAVMFILFVALFVGLYIFMVYKLSSKAAFYSKDLNITIAGMPVVVAAIMIAMQSNVIVSLGMVGALSVVRFRNAVKNPLDILYLFWSISAGIIVGVRLETLAIALCIVMTVLVLLLQLIPNSKASSLLILVANNDEVDWQEVKKTITENAKNVKEKSRSIKQGKTEVIYELTTSKIDDLVIELENKQKFSRINFLSHDGEYRI